MRRPHLLTPAGKRVIEQLRAGYTLRHDEVFGWFLSPPPGGKRGRLGALTVMRLLDGGYVDRVGAVGRLTDAGRAVEVACDE